MVNLHNLIAAVSPDNYCDSEVEKEVKEIIKKSGYLKAAEKAKFSDKNSEKHTLTYDSPSEGLEPVYFWILDFMKSSSKEVNKLVDNFVSSPGSSHFSEMGMKATNMQEQAMKLLGRANEVLRSIINLIYDLKEMKVLLSNYKDAKSKDPKISEAAYLSLKQRWMDMVDIRKGQGSINALASGALDFATLRDAFIVSKNLEHAEKLDLNDRVKRLVKQRLIEFIKWLDESEDQLSKRYEIERKYLRSQVNSLQLYSRWAKPYLKAAKNLEQNSTLQPESLVNVFNTIILELTLFARDDFDIEDAVKKGDLPNFFKKLKMRKFHPAILVEFEFRGIPQKVGQHYAYGGKTDLKFTSYALNEDELKVFKEELNKDSVREIMGLIEGTTTESLDEINKDVEEFLNDEKKKEEKKEEKDVNPFVELGSFFKWFFGDEKKDEKKKDLSKGIESDNHYEKEVRKLAINKAKEKCFNVFDIYKKAHGMPSHPNPFDK